MRRWLGAVAVGALLLGWVGWVAWLLVSPPTIEDGLPKRYHLACQPIGRDIKDVSLMGAVSDREASYVKWSAQNGAVGLRDSAQEENRLLTEATAACSELRTNRLASLVLVVTGGLAVLVVGAVVGVVRRLPRVRSDGS